MEQLVFSQVPVKGWVIDSNEHGLLDGPGNTFCFPAHNGKVVHTDGMSCTLTVLEKGGESSKVFHRPVPIGPF